MALHVALDEAAQHGRRAPLGRCQPPELLAVLLWKAEDDAVCFVVLHVRKCMPLTRTGSS